MGKKRQTEQIADRAAEIKDAARDIADVGGEAVKDFVSSTGSAARDFATATASAAKDLLEATERAVDRLNSRTEPKHRGRRIVRTGLAFGVAAAILANERARGLLAGGVRKLRGGTGEPEPWERPSDGEIKQAQPSGITP